MNTDNYKVGDIVRPADGSNYRGEIIYISKKEDVIKHKCLKTGKIYEKSYFGFFCRYCTLEQYEESSKRIIEEDKQLIAEYKAKPTLNEQEAKFLKNLEDHLELFIKECNESKD